MTKVGLTIGPFIQNAEPYCRALEAAGLEVRVLSSVHVEGEPAAEAARVLADLDGIVLSGGGDIDPALIGTPDAFHPTVYGHDRARDLWERAVFEVAWRREMPLFAICRGMQLMNWSLGGTLLADIDDLHEPRGERKGHRQSEIGIADRSRPSHAIRIESGSLLADIVGDTRLEVNSIHHQAVAQTAPGLVVTARADDGIIEAVEEPTRAFVLGVQFHPEEMWRGHGPCLAMFRRFAEAAARYRATTPPRHPDQAR